MDIIIDDFGVSLGKKSERLIIRKKSEVVQETPLFDISQITITSSGVSISTDVIQECMERGIQINFLTFNGQPYAQISSPNLTGTVMTRREQLAAYNDKRGVELTREIIKGKIKNQQNVLKYFARHRKETQPEVYRQIYDGISKMENHIKELFQQDANKIDDIRPQFLSIEGRAADTYWEMVGVIFADKQDFKGREHRGAQDPVNSALNYGYGMLYSQVWGALVLAGLDPFAGFMHVDRPGKPSLVLDVTEEFRQQVVDRVVIAIIQKGTEIEIKDGKLTDTTRKTLIEKFKERLESVETFDGKRFTLKSIIQKQARHIATFLRGESKYKAFVGKW
ncbi:MAG: CRISP-associated protein Cas1 [Thermoanaerobacteraceae bacterium]|nr:CRISP-associated protein Cas1 [Thermoanaerobacteraceae bacterium]